MDRKVLVKSYSNIKVRVSFYLYSDFEDQAIDIAKVVAFLGIKNPEVEDDFKILESTNQVLGWKEYTYEVNLNTGSNDGIWVAVGITVSWETHLSYNIDDIRIEIN
jgi:uncharacterized alkaline shock family protein YloU